VEDAQRDAVAAVERRLTKYPKTKPSSMAILRPALPSDFPSGDFNGYNVSTIVRGSHE
jgi:hypothetical protein